MRRIELQRRVQAIGDEGHTWVFHKGKSPLERGSTKIVFHHRPNIAEIQRFYWSEDTADYIKGYGRDIIHVFQDGKLTQRERVDNYPNVQRVEGFENVILDSKRSPRA